MKEKLHRQILHLFNKSTCAKIVIEIVADVFHGILWHPDIFLILTNRQRKGETAPDTKKIADSIKTGHSEEGV